MAKKYNGTINFASALRPTGAQPLDDRMVVQSLQDLLSASTFEANGASAAYNGMIVAVIEEQQVYMLMDAANLTSEESWIAVGSGNGSVAVETYAEAVELATLKNIGQIIYVKTTSDYDADGEGEGEAVEYSAAPYIVIGEGQLQKLAASEASGDLDSAVAELKTKVSTLESAVGVDGEEATGIYKKIADAQAAAEAKAAELDEAMGERVAKLEEIDHDAYVDADNALEEKLQAAIDKKVDAETYEAKVGELSTAISGKVAQGDFDTLAGRVDVAEGNISDIQDAVATKAEAEALAEALVTAKGYADAAQAAAEAKAAEFDEAMNLRVVELEKVDHDHENKTVLDGITSDKVEKWDAAQANVIEKIIFNGKEVVVDNQTKTVTLTTPADYITGLGADDKVLSVVDGKLSASLDLNYYKGEDGTYEIQLVGKDSTVLGRVDAKDFVKDGMLHNVELMLNPEGQAEGTYLVFTWNNESGVTAPMYVPVTSLIDVYNAGNGLDLNGKTFSISLQSNEKYLEVTDNGLATKGIDDAITTAKNALLGSEGDAATVGTVYGAKKYADEKAAAAQSAAETKAAELAAAAQSAAEIKAAELANAAQSAAETTAAADATQKADAAQAAAEATAAADATQKADAAEKNAKDYADGLNTAMNTRVEALEAIDHEHENMEVLNGIDAEKVAAWDAAEQNAKTYADNTFVKTENFNEFTTEMETKLEGVEGGAQVNKIEKVIVNDVEATITNKVAEVKVNADDIELGTAIKNGEEDKYAADTKISVVLQGIQDSIRGAIAGGVNSVSSGDKAIYVNSADANNPVITLVVETSTEQTVAAGHIEMVKGNDGLYGIMYYEGDDAE